MSNIPEMPVEWMPDSITVTGKYGNIELSFVILNTNKTWRDEIGPNMDGLRQAIWQAKHDEQFRETFCR